MTNASYVKRTLFFKQPAGTSRGVLLQKEVFYLILSRDENPSATGIGEIAPIPGLSPDAVPELEEKIKSCIAKINTGTLNPEKDFEGFPAIKFGYETALKGLETGSPVLLFPSRFTSDEKGIAINGLIWMGPKEFMLRQTEEKLEAGFKCLKFKIGAINFESEFKILESIRRRFPSGQLELRADANGAFLPGEAPGILKQLATLEIHSIEQPIRAGQVEAMKKLCSETPVPIALDEELIGIFNRPEKEKLLDTIKPRYIILKPTLTGGFAASEEWISLARERGIGWWVTSALESNIGLNAIAQWTVTLGTGMFQGLGTGSLFVNNIESPLYVSNGFLKYNPEKKWEIDFDRTEKL